MFAWLGSGRTHRRNVGAAGRDLDQAARAGLPVPSGAVLLDEFYRFALDNELIAEIGQRVSVMDSLVLHATLFESVHLPQFDMPVIVRAVAGDESDANAGDISDSDAVDSRDPPQMCRALSTAWSEAGRGEPTARRDVLLLQTVTAVCKGTAESRANAEMDLIEVWTPTGGSGEFASRPSAAYDLARLNRLRLPDENRPPYERRLQMLMRGVRRSLGLGDWVVTWADDGHICWLLNLSVMTPRPPLIGAVKGR